MSSPLGLNNQALTWIPTYTTAEFPAPGSKWTALASSERTTTIKLVVIIFLQKKDRYLTLE